MHHDATRSLRRWTGALSVLLIALALALPATSAVPMSVTNSVVADTGPAMNEATATHASSSTAIRGFVSSMKSAARAAGDNAKTATAAKRYVFMINSCQTSPVAEGCARPLSAAMAQAL